MKKIPHTWEHEDDTEDEPVSFHAYAPLLHLGL
jgi:hypothetical protein